METPDGKLSRQGIPAILSQHNEEIQLMTTLSNIIIAIATIFAAGAICYTAGYLTIIIDEKQYPPVVANILKAIVVILTMVLCFALIILMQDKALHG